MCEIDLDEWKTHSETKRRARKLHRCASCGGAIAAGETYVVHFWVGDGVAASEKMCTPCDDAMRVFGDAPGHARTSPSYFPELLRSCVEDGDEESDRVWRPMLAALHARGASALKSSLPEAPRA